ncbi:MAG: hypothetical protein HXS47_00610, partial [Theionarchaea archaeon]|nr:hypothetical protein [Theionarchaea archaeon]
HRIILKPEVWYTKVTERMVLESILEKVPVPKVEELTDDIEIRTPSP